jgi:multiple sugar transport system permease protein
MASHLGELDAPEIVDLGAVRPQTQFGVDTGWTRWIHDVSSAAGKLFVALVILVFSLPLVWMVGASLRQVGLPPPSQLEWVPDPVVFDNYPTIVNGSLIPFGLYLTNSLKVVALAVPFTIITASWAGFALAQIASRQRIIIIALSVAALSFPVTVLWLTRFIVYKWLGVLDSIWALVLPALMGSSPFYVLLFYWTFTRIPSELYESARLEGASALRVWASIAMPLSKPAIVAVSVLTFVLYWSNFLDPLLYLNDGRNYTLPVGLQALQQMTPTNFPLLMTGAVLITLPVILMFMFAQRWFLEDARGAGWLGR